jgi:hypothetical protein
LQDYINRILGIAYPEYSFEFIGYEKDDLKAIVDIDKSEVEAYKTLNEKRVERGLEKLDAEWADIPLNPQAVQLFQSAQAQQQDDGGGEEGDDGAWGDYSENEEDGEMAGGEESENTEEEEETSDQEDNTDEMQKSLLGRVQNILKVRV